MSTANGPEGYNNHQKSLSRRFWLVILSVVIYVFLYMFMSYTPGRGMGINAVIPVIVVGWCFGLVPGICTGALSLLSNSILCVALGHSWIDKFYVQGIGIFATGFFIIIGGIVGRMHDLGVKLSRELCERERAERELRQHRDKLDEVVELKTRELESANKALQEEINDRKQAVEQQRETKEHLENLIETSLDPIVVSDNIGCIIKPNKAFVKMVGYAEEEILGQGVHMFSVTEEGIYESTAGELVTIDEKFFTDNKALIERFFEESKISNWLSYYLRKDRKIIPVSQNLVMLYNDRNEVTGSFGIVRDITEQRRAELELIRAKEKAEEANEAKSNFLANMSHEIRTPMNGVIGFTDMLLETELAAEQEDYARTIKNSGEALLSLINGILDFSKIEAGRIEMEEIDFDIEVLAYDVCELIRPRLQQKSVELLCRIGDTLPAQIKGDPHRCRQVLINLMGNAAKFTQEGEIELSVDVEQEQQDQILIHARVRDTGIGIAPDKLENIFELFQQADGSTTRKYGGTGLGLSICRRIAQLMGGTVWAESQGDGGSIFHFTALLKPTAQRHAKRVMPVGLAGKRALITDDNRSNREILRNMLTSAGMQVSEAGSGKETLEALRQSSTSDSSFDICILDIMMPDITGYELAADIRRQYGAGIPLLAFTSSAVKGAQHCEEVGFNGFLPKPINRIRLYKMVERLLGEADGQDGKAAHASIITQHSLREDAKQAISILLAEDNPVNQKLAVKLLGKAGYRVEVANNGREAVTKYSEQPQEYDIIFMDIQMPELNGLDATREIRTWERAQPGDAIVEKQASTGLIPIVAMTANAMKGDREKCLEAGMNDYITKPIKREIVFQMLNKWVIDRL